MPGFSRPLRGSARTTLRAISRAGTRSSRATCTGPSRPSATEGGPQILHGSETMSTERIANGIGPARINLAYERRGDPGDPAVLLIMGLGAQLVHWPTGFLDVLVAHGLHVVRFDNRDSGRSTYMTEAPQPDLAAALAGDLSSVSYTLSDMAADAIGLLDHLGIARAHVVGASMGAAVAQVIAIEHPGRVRSLTSMMFTTGEAGVGQMHPDASAALFAGAPPATKEEAV